MEFEDKEEDKGRDNPRTARGTTSPGQENDLRCKKPEMTSGILIVKILPVPQPLSSLLLPSCFWLCKWP